MAKKSKKTNSVEDFLIDFSKAEEGSGGGARYKEGTYAVKIIAAKPTVSAEKKTPGLEVTFQFTEGKYKGKKLKDTLWATPKAYGRFRSLLEACGKKVPNKVLLPKIAKAVKGAELYVEVADEPGREGYGPRSRVTFDGFINVDDYEADDDDDLDDDEDDEDDDEDDDDEDDEDEEEDEDEDDEDDEDDDEEEDEDEEDDDDDDEEEEEVKPKKKAKAKAKPKAKKKAKPAKKSSKKKKAKDDDDDDEDEDIEDLDLDEL